MRSDPDEITAAFLYKACRELVMNAVKHAKATSIEVSLREDDTHFILQVMDDGIGMSTSHFRPDTAGNRGFGLFSLDESASYLGGRIDYESNGGGTKVIVVLPISDKYGETKVIDR